MNILTHGLVSGIAWWSPWLTFLIVLVIIQTEMQTVSLYLHRYVSHGSVKFAPAVEIFFRFVNWLTNSMTEEEWGGIHVKHHQYVDTAEDPHSPLFKKWVFPFGVFHYVDALRDWASIKKFVPWSRCPDDWLQKNVFKRFRYVGILITLSALVLAFGFKIGFVSWLSVVLLIPINGAGIINGLGHLMGYRNGDTPDNSRNLYPIAVLIGGEELHNNHHLKPESPKFSLRPGEVDVGWGLISLFERMGLAKVSPLIGKLPAIQEGADGVSQESVDAFWRFRYLVMKRFIKETRAHLKVRARAVGDDRRKRFDLLRKRMKHGGWFVRDVPSDGDLEVSRFQALRTKLADLCTLEQRRITREELREWLDRVRADGGERYQLFIQWVHSLRLSQTRL